MPAFDLAHPEDQYEDLLGLWSDLESALSVLLMRPLQVQDFGHKVLQVDQWLQELVAHDIDAALYLMFQLASTSTVGYSTSHALVCATLCHIMAQELQLPARERDSLVHAALTMNIGMTRMQDELAEQRERPSAVQQQAIQQHPQGGRAILERLYVQDALWLDVVAQHHTKISEQIPLAQQMPRDRLTRILGTIDRYAAMISPRKSRVGRSATDSVRAIVGQELDQRDEVGYTLVRTVGLCPPGTFVRLDNGDTAVVLRRSAKINFPLVASVLDPSGANRIEPRLHATHEGKPRVQSALARSAVSVDLDHRTMVRLGIYTARHSEDLCNMVSRSAALSAAPTQPAALN
jgi:hypothetical protein